MSGKPIVGIDIDGVLADFVTAFLSLSRWYLNRPDDEITEADNWDFKGQISGRDVKFLWEKIKFSTSCSNWWLTFDKMPNSDHLTDLYQHIDPIFITSRVSTRGLTPKEQSEEWLTQQYGIAEPKVIIVSGEKGPVAAELGLEWFIDDRPSNCESVKDTVPACNVFINDQKYNRELTRPDITRISSADEFLGLVTK